MHLPQILVDLEIPENCIEQRTSATEKGKSFIINPQRGDIIWRIQVDDCWLDSTDGRKVDYLFWSISRLGEERLSLVELKGENFGDALEQIESTLSRLYYSKPELRQFAARGGICIYVILSKGKGVPLNLDKIAKIKKRYDVIVHSKSRRLELDGVAGLC